MALQPLGHWAIGPVALRTAALRTAALRTGVGNKAGGGRDRENQACKGHGRVREGEDTPKLDQVERGDIEATREGEDTP